MCPLYEYANEHKNLLCSLFNNVFHLADWKLMSFRVAQLQNMCRYLRSAVAVPERISGASIKLSKNIIHHFSAFTSEMESRKTLWIVVAS